jgi:hypothetical protein
MASVFTVRERILLEMFDRGVGTWIASPSICKAITSSSGNTNCTFKEMTLDGTLLKRSAKNEGGLRVMEYSLTEKGGRLAMTQVWRMRVGGIKSVRSLPIATRRNLTSKRTGAA